MRSDGSPPTQAVDALRRDGLLQLGGVLWVIVAVMVAFGCAPPPQQVATPTIDPASGSAVDWMDVTITTVTADATIYYTTDGSDPTDQSPVYEGPIRLTASATVKARAVKAGLTDSEVASADLTVTPAATYTSSLTWHGDQGGSNIAFNQPERIEVDSVGNVYVPDSANARVVKFNGQGVFQAEWNNGLFVFPAGVALDATGNVYVAERGLNNYRIRVVDSNGTSLRQWGTPGSLDGQFIQPRDVAVDSSSSVYVADMENQRIQKFTSDGTFLTKWGKLGTGASEFNGPLSVAVDGDDNVYVADRGNDRIQKFTSDGTYVTQWGSSGTGQGQFDSPFAVTVGPAGNVFVADHLNDRVQKFTSDGTFITEWGGSGAGAGQLDGPAGVAVDSDGNVYVAEWGNHRIQKFTRAQ